MKNHKRGFSELTQSQNQPNTQPIIPLKNKHNLRGITENVKKIFEYEETPLEFYHLLYELMKTIQDKLWEKFPCQKCKGHGTNGIVGDGYDYPEEWCRECNGAGFKLPEIKKENCYE